MNMTMNMLPDAKELLESFLVPRAEWSEEVKTVFLTVAGRRPSIERKDEGVYIVGIEKRELPPDASWEDVVKTLKVLLVDTVVCVPSGPGEEDRLIKPLFSSLFVRESSVEIEVDRTFAPAFSELHRSLWDFYRGTITSGECLLA